MKHVSSIRAGWLYGGLSLLSLSLSGCLKDVVLGPSGTHGTGGASVGTGEVTASAGTSSGTVGMSGVGGGGAGAAGTGAGDAGMGASGTGAMGTGDAGMPASCPATQPAADSACPTIGADCTYGGTQCACEYAMTWQCSSCPSEQPAPMSPCTPTMGLPVCDYAATQCICLGQPGAEAWTCDTCPSAKPAQGSDCSDTSFVGGFSCSYGGAQCTCSAQNGNTWDCGVTTCPATEPTLGVACDILSSEPCQYGSVKCYCMDAQFYCDG